MKRFAKVGPYDCGEGCPLLVIAGPCVIQEDAISTEIAETVQAATDYIHQALRSRYQFDHPEAIQALNQGTLPEAFGDI